jgi:ribonuclease Z
MEFTLLTLGVASALPTINRYQSAHILKIRGRLFLIDCGECCQVLLKKSRISILKIDNIFLSHLHGDHTFGIFGLLSTMSMMGRTAPLTIYAPQNFKSFLDFFVKQSEDYIKYEIRHVVLSADEPTIIYSTKKLTVSAFPLNHRVPTYGFIFKENEPQLNVHKELVQKENMTLREIGQLKRGEDVVREDGSSLEASKYTFKPYIPRSFAYCCDTAPFEKLKQWINGVDLLYHEATFTKELQQLAEKTYHSTAEQAGTLAKEGNVGKLIIGHFSSRYTDLNLFLDEAVANFKNTELATLGKTFEIELKQMK